ncbi:MAG: hypothetical protein RM338_01645, partial [Nostoc sp. DedQUE12a]|nr:hypothetical protein [Nostoc sp. DedQUE12a]
SSSLIWIFVTSSTTTGKILKPFCLLPPAFCLKARNFSSSPKADNNQTMLQPLYPRVRKSAFCDLSVAMIFKIAAK